jgi:hypothetical protein
MSYLGNSWKFRGYFQNVLHTYLYFPRKACLFLWRVFGSCFFASDSEFFIVWELKHCLIAHAHFWLLEVCVVMVKVTVLTVELVDASVKVSNGAIAEELLEGFRGVAVPAPWVKEVKKVVEGF